MSIKYDLHVTATIESGDAFKVPQSVTVTLADGREWFAVLVGAMPAASEGADHA